MSRGIDSGAGGRGGAGAGARRHDVGWHGHRLSTGLFWIAAIGVLAAVQPAPVRADDAEVVSLVGKGDSRETADADWKPAAVKQKLRAGWFVRTREMSQMALLLKDNTQVRLNQLSILNIKSIGASAQTTRLDLQQGRGWSQSQTSLDLQRGRIWAQFKSVLYGVTIALGATPVTVTTKSATIGIRGTDWEVAVGDDDKTTVTLLSGEADVSNDFGRVSLGPNEQATAEVGKAPVKRYLTDASDRVQWVTSYRPQPRRWVQDVRGVLEAIVKNIEAQDYAPALDALAKDKTLPRLPADLLLADLSLFLGEPAKAIALLAPHAAEGRGDPMASALLARALLIAGRIADAGRVLKNAGQKHGDHVEVLLSQAEFSRLQGDTEGTRHAALKVLEIDAKNAEAWYVIGRIETEREYVKAAREALRHAIALRPDGPGYRGELATLETFANEFSAADEAFREALAQHPDDYVALTGLGVLQLKRGETEAALESFLKAGVIEPRYARAWFFSGVAYYQLEDRGRALEAFQKASTLDDKDPLPHLVSSLVYFDALELGRAIEAAREAQARMPFLKSLNQVLTDQKGNANVGSALAAFGLEEWSQAYAFDSYSPYWAGSPLFLSDRFSGTFNKNSELFKGFLSDPSVFGASNRFSSILPVPGHYGSLEAKANREYITEAGISAALNGYTASRIPFAYSLAVDRTEIDSRINASDADGRFRAQGKNYIVGLGVKPTHELGVFAFANGTTYDVHLADRASGLMDDAGSVHSRRYDVGLNYKFSPTNQAWLKRGEGSEKQPVSGAFEFADELNQRFGTSIFRPGGRLNEFQYDQSQRDVQWRHTLDVAPRWQLSWGLEHATEGKPSSADFQIPVMSQQNPNFSAFRIRQTQDNHIEAGTAYVSSRLALAPALDAQLDLFYQDVKTRFVTSQDQILIISGVAFLTPVGRDAGANRDRELNPRLGFKWRPAPGHQLRLAAQVWRKPPGVNTLAPVDTAGIPVEDQLETAGGRLKRIRLQHEIQLGAATFSQWFVDFKDVNNVTEGGADVVPDLKLVDLERLRSRRRVYSVRQEYLEDTPKFGAGRVDQFGMSVNRLLSRHMTAAARYVYADTRNTTPAFAGREIPFHPRHYLNLALNWQPYARWVVGPTATYRSSRYRDEANLEPLAGGWAFGLGAYWESEDKRWSVAGVIDHVHSDKQSSIYRDPVVLLQAVYRF